MKPFGFTAEDLMRAIIETEPQDPWHDHSSGDRWYWHASQLAACPRQLILKRAGFATDPRPLDGQLTMLVGTMFHERIQRAWPILEQTGKHRVVLIEEGMRHPELPLAAKPDALLEIEGIGLVLLDFKSEHEEAAKRRSAEARENGSTTKARPEHQIQVAATAMVLEANGYKPIEQAAVIYASKNSFWLDGPTGTHVELKDGLLYREVRRRLRVLEEAWAEFERTQALPPRLPDGSWQCAPQKNSPVEPAWGRWCSARHTCFLR